MRQQDWFIQGGIYVYNQYTLPSWKRTKVYFLVDLFFVEKIVSSELMNWLYNEMHDGWNCCMMYVMYGYGAPCEVHEQENNWRCLNNRTKCLKIKLNSVFRIVGAKCKRHNLNHLFHSRKQFP